MLRWTVSILAMVSMAACTPAVPEHDGACTLDRTGKAESNLTFAAVTCLSADADTLKIYSSLVGKSLTAVQQSCTEYLALLKKDGWTKNDFRAIAASKVDSIHVYTCPTNTIRARIGLDGASWPRNTWLRLPGREIVRN